MKEPIVCTTIRDEKNKVTYHVMAVRELTPAEAHQAVEVYKVEQRQCRRKMPKDTTITIISVIGAD
jgi:hypothetical protein